MSGVIHSLEIFAAGTHRAMTGKVTVTEEDLDQIVEAFTSLSGTNIVRPHLKLGHTDAQKWFGQKDGIPSLGWITSVWREGKKLLANVANVPDALINLIRLGRFHNVSAEVFWDAPIEHDGKRFPRVLSAVALLGVEMPAVKDLAGLASALFQEGPIHQFTDATAIELTEPEKEHQMPDPNKPTASFTQEQVDALIAAAVDKAVKEATSKFESDLKDRDTQLEVVTKRAEQAEAALGEASHSFAAKEAELIVETAIKEGKLKKTQKDFAVAMLTASDTKVKFGDGEKSMKEVFSEFLAASGSVVDTSQHTSKDEPAPTGETPSQTVDARIKAAQKDDPKLTYADAYDRVLAADPELAKQYGMSQS